MTLHLRSKSGGSRKPHVPEGADLAAFWDGLDLEGREHVFAVDNEQDGSLVIFRYRE